jgi:hypothetical protein
MNVKLYELEVVPHTGDRKLYRSNPKEISSRGTVFQVRTPARAPVGVSTFDLPKII